MPAPRIIRARAEPAPTDFKVADRLLAQAANHQAETELTDLEGAAHALVVAARAHVSSLQAS